MLPAANSLEVDEEDRVEDAPPDEPALLAVVLFSRVSPGNQTLALPSDIQQLKVQKEKAVESAAENVRTGLKAHEHGDPLARELFQQAQREDALAGLTELRQQLQRNDSPALRSAYASYMSSLEPYLVGDVVNPQLRSFACANSALVIGASERLDQAEGELDRFRRRPAAKLENPACAFLRILHAEDCSGDAIRVQDRNLLC